MVGILTFGILAFMSRKFFMLSRVEHEKMFYISKCFSQIKQELNGMTSVLEKLKLVILQVQQKINKSS